MAINRSGKSGSGKNRKNCPSSTGYLARSGNADARSFDSFEGVGGYGDGKLEGGKMTRGIPNAPKNSGNEGGSTVGEG